MPVLPGWLREALLLIGPILLAVTVHELAHGYMAFRLGDPTAKMAGRLTLNPLKHLDLIGTAVFFLTQAVGWAKPVPINPGYFRSPRRDMVLTALAGPAVNLALAGLLAVAHRAVGRMTFGPDEQTLFAVFEIVYILTYLGVMINLGLAVFNLLPLPPLDGFTLVEVFLPPRLLAGYYRYRQAGLVILLALSWLGLIGQVILPIISYLRDLLLR